jgi:DNA-binding IclR family transcriptional regulator
MRKSPATPKRGTASGDSERERLQALTRGLQAIAHMNRAGVSSNGALAKRLGLKYSTAHRVLMVLTDLGLTQHDPVCHQFVLAKNVSSLAAGFRDEPVIDDVALPLMIAWTKRHGLPLVLVTEAPRGLAIRAATDGQRPISADRCITGGIIAARGSSEAAVINAFAAQGASTDALRTVRRQGFAKRILKQHGEIHISVPVELSPTLFGCLSIRCSLSMMDNSKFVQRWAAALHQLAADIVSASH